MAKIHTKTNTPVVHTHVNTQFKKEKKTYRFSFWSWLATTVVREEITLANKTTGMMIVWFGWYAKQKKTKITDKFLSRGKTSDNSVFFFSLSHCDDIVDGDMMFERNDCA